MTTEQMWLGAMCAAVTVLAVTALVLAQQARGRARRAQAQVAALAERIGVLEAPGAVAAQPATGPADTAYLITRMDPGQHPAPHVDAPVAQPVAQPIDGRLFADIVARETVVKAASWTHGLRRALSAEQRNRIRFAVRQETRRAGRDRRAETKQALREFRAREQAAKSSPAPDIRSEAREDVA